MRVGVILTGAFNVVSLDSQFFSIPLITDRKTRTNQTTKEITKMDTKEIIAEDKAFFFGIKYLKARKDSNIKTLFSFFKDYMTAQFFIVFFAL